MSDSVRIAKCHKIPIGSTGEHEVLYEGKDELVGPTNDISFVANLSNSTGVRYGDGGSALQLWALSAYFALEAVPNLKTLHVGLRVRWPRGVGV